MSDHLFELLWNKHSRTARKVHIRRLYDVLRLCIERNDLPRARKAWDILIRCKEFDWKVMWQTAVHLLGSHSDDNRPEEHEFLRVVMLQCPSEVWCMCR